MAPIGQVAEVVVWRDRRELTFQVTVGERERTFAQLSGGVLDPETDPSGLVRRPNRPGPYLGPSVPNSRSQTSV